MMAQRAPMASRSAAACQPAVRNGPLLSANDPANAADLGPPFPEWTGATTDATLQPPKPQIEPSPRVLERITSHDMDVEAGD
jgi:hypothetical protein